MSKTYYENSTSHNENADQMEEGKPNQRVEEGCTAESTLGLNSEGVLSCYLLFLDSQTLTGSLGKYVIWSQRAAAGTAASEMGKELRIQGKT